MATVPVRPKLTDLLHGRQFSAPRLRELLDSRFDKEEFRTLCDDLGVDYDDLRGESQAANAREFMRLMRRRRQLDLVVAWLAENRPDVHQDLLAAPPPRWSEHLAEGDYEGLLAWAVSRWPVLVALVAAEVALFSVFFRFRDRHLLSLPLWLGIAALLAVMVLAWGAAAYSLVERRRWPPRVAVAVLLTLAAGGLLGQQAYAAQRPAPFPREGFHVLIGAFAEGADFTITPRSRELGLRLQQQMDSALARAGLQNVRVRTSGVIRDLDEARADGAAVGAEVVVWGWLIGAGGGALTVNFSVIETPDTLSASAYPRILPVIDQALTPELVLRGGDTIENSDEVARQLTTIVSFTIGLAHYLGRDFPAASRDFLQALNSLPATAPNTDRALVLQWLGRSYQQRGDNRRALDYLGQAQALNPDDPVVPLAMAFSHLTIDEKDKGREAAGRARRLLLDALDLNPRHQRARYDLGLAYQALEDDARALDEYLKIIREQPDFYIAYISAARIYGKRNQVDVAIDLLNRALEVGARTPWAYLEIGEMYWRASRIAEARQALETAARGAPTEYWMAYRLAEFYASQGEHAAAQQTYDTMLKHAPDKRWAHGKVGEYYAARGAWDDAVDAYLDALRERQEAEWIHKLLGDAYRALGKRELAVAEYEKALALQPNAWYIRGDFALLLLALGQADRAIQELERVFQEQPSLVDERLFLADAYEKRNLSGDRLKAFEVCQTVRERTTNERSRADAQACLDRLQPEG